MYIIPCAGRGSRFYEAGYTEFKPFIKIGDKTMIECVIKNLKAENPILITREEYAERASKYGSVVTTKGLTEGAACTVLLAEKIITDEELIIANSDQVVDIDFNDFLTEARKYDACIMTFENDHPKWSYAKTCEGLVTEVAEKKVISNHATVGIYYYKNGRDFVKAANRMIQDNFRVNGEFYVCPAFNWLPRDKKIGIYEIKPTEMLGLGVPDDFKINSKRVGEIIN